MFPALTTSARVWLVLAGLVVARVVADWPLADNHICLLAYWCLGVAWGCGTTGRGTTL